MDADEIKKLKEERRTALVKKWGEGKTLTESEAEEIKDLIGAPKKPKRAKVAWGKNKAEGARMLGVTRETFDRVLKTPGCPPRAAKGWYNITAITEFMGTAGFRAGAATRTDDLASDKRKKARYEALMAELDYEKATSQLVPIDIAERVVGDAFEAMRAGIRNNPRFNDEEKSDLLKHLADGVRETLIRE